MIRKRRVLRRAAAVGLMLSPGLAFGESLTLTTWYPAPYGIYSQLRSAGDSYFSYGGGRVGIGTLAPDQKLSVAGGALRVDGALSGTPSGNTVTLSREPAFGKLQSWGAANPPLALNPDGNDVLMGYPGSKVGIGSPSPGGKLEVDGNISIYPGGMAANESRYFGQAAHSQQASPFPSNTSSGFTGIEFEDIKNAGTQDSSQQLHFWTHHRGVQFARRLTIDIDGNVKFAGNLCAMAGGNCLVIDGSNHLRPTYRNGMDLGDPNNTFSTLFLGNGVYLNGTAYNNPDYVFEPGYKPLSLDELATFTRAQKKLPGMKSTEEIKKDGMVDVTETVRKLTEKLEESTLYILQLHERIRRLEEKVSKAERATRAQGDRD